MLRKSTGRSMRPLIWENEDLIGIVPMDRNPRVNDLLVFGGIIKGEEKVIFHRVVKVKRENGNEYYVTRGDNNHFSEVVKPGQVIGRAQEIIRIAPSARHHAIKAKQFTVDDRAFIRYSRIWMAIWPLRFVFYHIRNFSNRILHWSRKIFSR